MIVLFYEKGIKEVENKKMIILIFFCKGSAEPFLFFLKKNEK